MNKNSMKKNATKLSYVVYHYFIQQTVSSQVQSQTVPVRSLDSFRNRANLSTCLSFIQSAREAAKSSCFSGPATKRG